MKLRNKKTGKIGYTAVLRSKAIFIVDENAVKLAEYTSLAKLNEEWEDCNGYYYIGDGGDVNLSRTKYRLEHEDEAHEEIGNYFETKEEAEKAVEKLKAWKRLKDKGFRFDPVDRYEALCGNGFNIPITATMPPEAYTDAEVSKDLDLLFGGEK